MAIGNAESYKNNEKLFVMVLTRNNNNMIRENLVNKSMFLCDAAGPMSRQIPSKRFRLASSMEGFSYDFDYQLINFIKNFYIIFGPLAVLSKGRFGKTDHFLFFDCAQVMASSKVEKVITFPCSTSRIDFSRCSRLAGERQRYSVSFCSLTNISISWSGYVYLSELMKLSPNSFVLSLYVVSITAIITKKAADFNQQPHPEVEPKGSARLLFCKVWIVCGDLIPKNTKRYVVQTALKCGVLNPPANNTE